MKNGWLFTLLCAGGLAVLASPALGQPRGRGGMEGGPRAAAAEPAAREQALEQQVRELQMQLKRLQEAMAGSQPRAEAGPQAADGDRRGPAPAARRPESPAQPPEGRFQGRDGGPGGMPRGMREPPARTEARDRQAGPAPFAGRADGPLPQQVGRGPMMGQGPAFGRRGQFGSAGPQNVLTQVRQILDQARAMILRAEQLLDQQGPRAEAGRGLAPRGPGMQQDGRGGPPALGGRGGFAPPAEGREGRMGQGPMRPQPPVDVRPGPQGPRGGGPMQGGPGQGQGFRGGRFGPGGPGAFGDPDQGGPVGRGPGGRGEGRFGPPRDYQD